jgi:amino acid transporter
VTFVPDREGEVVDKVEADGRLRGPEVTEHGLKSNAIGFREALIIGIASTAPAYSLAAVIGLVVVTVGVQAPAVLLASFVPMFFVATAFYYMNRADQDCGTTFSWVTRAMGPWLGWMGGWAICVTGILVVGSLADVAARYTYLFLVLGAILLVLWRLGGHERFFSRRPETVPSEVAKGLPTVPETAGAPPEER